MQLIINVRSGVISGIFEGIALLILAPIITRGTAQVYNLMVTRRIFTGKLVRISDDSMSVEDIVPRAIKLIRTARNRKSTSRGNVSTGLSRQCVTLMISLIMSVGILLLSVFTDGKTVPTYETRDLFIWNNATFVDSTRSTGLDSRAGDVLGMAGVRRACINRTDADSFNMYAVGFFDIQNFEQGRSANGSVCLDGEQTKERQGISLSTNRIFNPPADPVYKEDMEGEPAQFTFIRSIDRTGTPDYCRVLVTTEKSSEVWTLSSEYRSERTRFAVRAVRNESNVIIVKIGVAYHFLNNDEIESELPQEFEDCDAISTTMFASNRFTAEITEIDVTLNLTHVELTVADMLSLIVESGYGRLESQEIMLRAYYAGTRDSEEDSGEPLGTFIRRQVAVATGGQQVTELSTLAIVGAILTAFGTVLLLGVAICFRPQVRLTSSTYVSQLYVNNASENGQSSVKDCDYVEAVDGHGTKKRVRPLSLGYNTVEVYESDFT